MFKSPHFRSTPHLRTQSEICFLQRCFDVQRQQVKNPFQIYHRNQFKIKEKQCKTSLKKKNSIQSKSTQKSQFKLESIASSPNIRNSKIFNMKKSQTSVFTTVQFKNTTKEFKQKTLKRHPISSNLAKVMFPRQEIAFLSHNNFKIIPNQISYNPIKQKPFQQIQKRIQIKNLLKTQKKNNCMSPQSPSSPQYQIQVHFQAQQEKWNNKYQGSLELINSVSSQMINSQEKNQLIENKRSQFLQKTKKQYHIPIPTMQTLLSPNQFRDTVSMNMQQSRNNTSIESLVIGRNMY